MTWEAVKKEVHLFMHHGVRFDVLNKLKFFSFIGQLATQQEVTDFHIIRMICQLFNRVTAMEENLCLHQ